MRENQAFFSSSPRKLGVQIRESTTDRKQERLWRKGRTGEDCRVLRGSLTRGMRLAPSEEANTEDDDAQAQGGCRHRDLHCLDGGQPRCCKAMDEVLKVMSTA